MVACLLRTIVWYCRLIYQLYYLYNSTKHTVLASEYPFLPVYSKAELRNVLNNTSTHSLIPRPPFNTLRGGSRYETRVHIATPTRNIPEASKIQTPLYSGHVVWSSWCQKHGVCELSFIQMVLFTNSYFHFG